MSMYFAVDFRLRNAWIGGSLSFPHTHTQCLINISFTFFFFFFCSFSFFHNLDPKTRRITADSNRSKCARWLLGVSSIVTTGACVPRRSFDSWMYVQQFAADGNHIRRFDHKRGKLQSICCLLSKTAQINYVSFVTQFADGFAFAGH